MMDLGSHGHSMQLDGLIPGLGAAELAGSLQLSNVEVLTNPGELSAAFLDTQDRARNSIMAFDRGTSESKPAGMENTQRNALERGVNYRVVYSPSAFASGNNSPMISGRDLPKASMRVSTLVPTRLMVRDAEESLVISTAGPAHAPFGVRVRSSWFAGFLLDTFQTIWDSALPVSQERFQTQRMLSRAEQEILQLLATGLTDESIARSLGVSLRTIQRKVQGIQRSVGATSRFQLGAMTAA